MELPDFHIPHAEKIDWMIATTGWALEPVAADVEAEPPTPGYAYSIGMPAAVGFPEVAVFGLTPVAANGLVTLVADACRGGTEIPLGVELVGLLDNDLRCMFAPDRPGPLGAVVLDRSGLVPRRSVRGRPAALSRPQRVHAVRSRVRTTHDVRPAGHRYRVMTP